MPYLNIGDADIWYETAGEGRPLLLVAGIASDVASWTPVVPMLSQSRQLIMFDNRGAGRTRFHGPIQFRNYVDDALALLDHLEIRKTDVFGHSMGGMIALRMAEHAPDRLGRIVAGACAAEPDARTTALMAELSDLYHEVGDPAVYFRLLFHWLFAPPFFDNMTAVDEAARMAVAYEYCQSPDNFRRQIEALASSQPVALDAIENEVLMLLPELDILVPPEATRQSLGGLANVSETVIAGAGHSVHWERPQEVSDAVLAFLERSK